MQDSSMSFATYANDNPIFHTDLDMSTESRNPTKPPQKLSNHLSFITIPLRLVGILPVQWDREKNGFKYSWKSPAALLNFVWCGIGIYSALFILGILKYFIRDHSIDGTDFYVAILNYISVAFTSLAILIAGTLVAPRFCQGLGELDQISLSLGTTRKEIWFRSAYLPLQLTFNIVFVMGVALSLGQRKSPSKFKIPIFAAAVSTFLTSFTPLILEGAFVVLTWICTLFYEKYLNFIRSEILLGRIYDVPKWQQLYIELISAIETLLHAFDIQLCAFLLGRSLRFCIGCYIVLSNILGLSVNSAMQGLFIEAVLTSMIGFRLLLLFYSVDLLEQKQNTLIHILENLRYAKTHSPYSLKKLDSFIMKIGLFPLRLKALNFINLNLSFVSAAAPNVICYLLVMVQFKQLDGAFAEEKNSTNISN